MIDLKTNKITPDEEVIFYDGFLYIISATEVYEKGEMYSKIKYNLDVICLCPEYDDPISLKDIRESHPFVHKVLYEDYMFGKIFNYNNHKTDDEEKKWEEYGVTMGFV